MGSDQGAGCIAVAASAAIILLMLVACFGANAGGYSEGRRDTRAEAVEHGYGEWVPDKNGKTTFKWKE